MKMSDMGTNKKHGMKEEKSNDTEESTRRGGTKDIIWETVKKIRQGEDR